MPKSELLQQAGESRHLAAHGREQGDVVLIVDMLPVYRSRYAAAVRLYADTAFDIEILDVLDAGEMSLLKSCISLRGTLLYSARLCF